MWDCNLVCFTVSPWQSYTVPETTTEVILIWFKRRNCRPDCTVERSDVSHLVFIFLKRKYSFHSFQPGYVITLLLHVILGANESDEHFHKAYTCCNLVLCNVTSYKVSYIIITPTTNLVKPSVVTSNLYLSFPTLTVATGRLFTHTHTRTLGSIV